MGNVGQEDIGVGVVGLGMGRHVLHVNRDPASRLVVRGICDLDERKLADLAAAFDVELATTDYEELLGREDIRLIGVYSPDHLHCAQILAALAAGKHVLVTKPMVNTLAEAEQVIAAVRGSGRKLMVGQTQRFRPEYMAAKELVDSGRLGAPVFVETSYVHDMRPVLATPGRDWRRDPGKKDWLAGAACHPIDLARWFAGEVDSVTAFANNGGVLPGRAGDNNFVLNLKFRNGAIGRVLALFSVVQPPSGMHGLTFCGTRGSIAGDRVSMDGPDGVVKCDLEVPATQAKGHASETARILRHMAACIIEDRPPMIDAVQAARTLAVAVAAIESIATGRSAKPRTEF